VEEARAATAALHPLGHMGDPDDVAYGILYLASEESKFMTGAELVIDGGYTTEPSLILLDEPFSGVDPVAVEELQAEIRHLREDHDIAMLVTDHNVQRTLEIVDRAYVIFEGQVFAEGHPRDIINNQQVRELYLGSTFRGDEFD
jgi:lipopolysaccharide export system ATP-binding protein